MPAGLPPNPNANPPPPRLVTASALLAGGGLFATPKHVSSDWEVSTTHQFDDLVFSSYGDTVNLTELTIDVSTYPSILYWRVRYNFEGGTTTPWSEIKLCFNGIWCDFEYGAPVMLVEGAPDSVPLAGARLFGGPLALPPGGVI